MDRYGTLRPERFTLGPDDENSTQNWNHWFKTFQNYIISAQVEETDKIKVLINFISPAVYEYISECHSYNDAIVLLKNIYSKPVNEVFARHKLKCRRQDQGETIDKYIETLKRLAKDCNFKAVTAETNRDDSIRDAFIYGLQSSNIRQRLLENFTLTLDEAIRQARSLELAQIQSQQYLIPSSVNAVDNSPNSIVESIEPTIAAINSKCYYCGLQNHRRILCPARESMCKSCGIKGHWQKVCRKKNMLKTSESKSNHFSNCIASVPYCLKKTIVPVTINGVDLFGLVDTGSSASFINESTVGILKIPVISNEGAKVSIASTSLYSSTKGKCEINLHLQGYNYRGLRVSILPNLCSDIIIGHDVLRRHSSVQVHFGGTEPPLNICSVAVANLEPAQLFTNLSSDCKPISIKSRRHTSDDLKFIESEIATLLKEGIIEESISPWRAQVLVVSTENHRRRMVVDYSQTINRYTELDAFPLPRIDDIVNKVASYQNAVVSSIDEQSSFTVETDASEYAIGASLSQNNRPVAFFSRSLSKSEQNHSSVEKEAYAIVEALRKWRHFLIGRHFRLITDQRSVSFMFDRHHPGKIKNEKIMRWRLELSSFNYEIIYRPGDQNSTADTLSRICSSITGNLTQLVSLHKALCHPGETRMYHWTRSKNLPFSLTDVRKVTSSCRICAEVKPRFHKHEGHLIKATRPFERINLDFKGPLPSSSRNRYLLVMVDEFSRFPLAFPCSDVTASTVISKFKEVFSLFGVPAYIHSDRGSSFMSYELKAFLTALDVATSRTTPYNPQGNGQSERYVGIVWKTIELAVKNHNLSISQWEQVYQEALHSIRSLLCTSTNMTPHERFFGFPRRSSNGSTIPSWLLNPGPVLMKRPVRNSKYEPLVEEVMLLEANPEYAHVRLSNGKETTVSLRHLAPVGSSLEAVSDLSENPAGIDNQTIIEATDATPEVEDNNSTTAPQEMEAEELNKVPENASLRRSERERYAPSYLKDYIH